MEVLSEREKEILEAVVQQFVLTGDPVGSRTISKKRNTDLSPATIRNVMADLEEKGYLNHPHTSAGRVPTTKGYRLYVDSLISMADLSHAEMQLIDENIGRFSGDVDLILEKTVGVLASISNQLGLILMPKFEDGILERIDLIQVSSDKILVVLNIHSGLAKTVLLEVRHDLSVNMLNAIAQVLNERLAGLKIREIKATLRDRIKDLVDTDPGIIRLFVDSADLLFDVTRYQDIKYTGTSRILTNPEFSDIQKFSALIELFEQKNIIIHMMEKRRKSPGINVTIGDENEEESIQQCTIITAPYRLGQTDGLLGVIGPMRMAYRRIIPVVDYTARLITRMLE